MTCLPFSFLAPVRRVLTGLMAGAGLAAVLLSGHASAAGLDDAGVTQCGNLTQNGQACPQAGFPSQDAETGRDAQAGLQKAGAGPAGFDYTKLDAAGQPLPDSATNWDCIRDNVTGLIWEIKTDDNGLRDQDWTYTWYNPNGATNGGHAGSTGSNTCNSTLPSGLCNTLAYATAVNALATPLCGKTDWRLPTREELRSIVDYSAVNPSITATYFPRTVSNAYWSASPYAPDAGVAWVVFFNIGNDLANGKGNSYAVRLVRGGQ